MKTSRILAVLAATLLAVPALAAGDAANGEKIFKKCKACHTITNGDQVIVKGGRVGPNLYGVVGRAAGSYEGFKYSKGLKEMGAAGLVWTEALVAEYVVNPTKFIDANGGEGRSKMSFKLKKGGEDVAAYLASVGPKAN